MEYDNLERVVQTYITYKLKDRPASHDSDNSIRVRDRVREFSVEYNPQYYLIDRDMDLFLARISALLCNTANPFFCKDVDHQLEVIRQLLQTHLGLEADATFPIVKNIIVHINYATEFYNPDWHILSVKTYEYAAPDCPCETMYQLYRVVSDAHYFEHLGAIGIARTFSQKQSIENNYRNLIYNLNCGELLYYNLSKEKARPHIQFLKMFLKQLHRDLG